MKKITFIISICLAIFLFASCAASAPAGNQSDAPAAEEPASAYEPPVYEPEAAGEAGSYDLAPAMESDGWTESYIPIDENTPRPTDMDSLVTFSLKVDTASYTNVARYIENWDVPPKDAVKVEEMINYFAYDTPAQFDGGDPFAIYTEVGRSPFGSDRYIAFIRVKAKELDRSALPPSNLTFLIDTSGSMDSYDKLPLLAEAFEMLTDTLDARDRVSIVTYAGNSSVVLQNASGADKGRIMSAIRELEAGGSTAGAEGIWTAYGLAEANYIEGGNNRVILATDGDFNVGISSLDELSGFIGAKRESGVYLSALGFGTDNLKDDIMETLARDGNGNYNYINSLRTARKVLVDELSSNLYTIADDVKAQVEFNPVNVTGYRLVGYENRKLDNRDFSDDTKDAGEIGVGTDVALMFELELANGAGGGLKYGSGGSAPAQTDFSEYGDELFEVRIRYKDPGEPESNLVLEPVTFDEITISGSSDFNFACSVAEFGQMLRGSEYAGGATTDEIIALAAGSLGDDSGGYRAQHLSLLRTYQDIEGW
jgi:Ca-activated chloride channel family protein